MKEGVVFFIEFKALGKTPTTLQEKTIQRIREQNIKVFVVDDIEEGKKIVDSF
jgi:molybdopterin-guanine dinucleotide biosynthesis protein